MAPKGAKQEKVGGLSADNEQISADVLLGLAGERLKQPFQPILSTITFFGENGQGGAILRDILGRTFWKRPEDETENG